MDKDGRSKFARKLEGDSLLHRGCRQIFVHQRNLMSMTLNRVSVLIAVYIERYALSLLYFYLASVEFNKSLGILSGRLGTETTVFIDTAHHLILFLLGIFTGLLLLLARRATVPPQKPEFILVPLATTFFNLLYYTVPWFPVSLQTNLCPQGLQMPLLAAGLVCIIIGPMFALSGILYLGRSFGIYVTVRKVVMTGPYQWVRHPMYLGWVCTCIGVALANCSSAYFLLVALHISLLLYRAHLEETQLSAHSPEYREYMKHTRFIFPRFRFPINSSVKAE
jgi:protein-S-isoprenylcysteine O-methyltransferase Ste14